MSRRKLFIHIGVQRTATTSIQGFLKTNAAVLRGQGVLPFGGGGRNLPLMTALHDGRIDAPEAARRITAQADRAEDPIHTITLSEEDICSRGGFEAIAGLRQVFDVTLLLVVRRQDLWIESWYRQNVKWQWNPDLCHLRFDDFLAQRSQFAWVHYDQLLGKLEPLFGAENIQLMVFEPGQMADAPLDTFCQAVGVQDLSQMTYPKHRQNASASPLMGEFMRNLPLDEFPDAYRRRVERACIHADWYVKRRSGPQSTLFMDLETRQNLLAEYADGNAAVAQRYLGRDQLFAESLPPADAPLAPQDLPADSYQVVEDFVAPLLRAIIAETLEADMAKG